MGIASHDRAAGLWLALLAVLAIVGIDGAFANSADPSGRRLALVVGNSNYRAAEFLKNAVNDSRAVAARLRALGFEVTSVEDAPGQGFRDAVEGFGREAAGAETVLFYYSGHGFQLGGTNYLVPTDAALRDRRAVEQETLSLNTIITTLQGRGRQTLIFLDACRNNPLPPRLRDQGGLEGLAQIEAGSGVFVAFATQPGNITRDGAGDNSPFTTALLENMEVPGISVSDMMIRVRNRVETLTLRQQIPWDQSSLRSQFYFVPEKKAYPKPTAEEKELLRQLALRWGLTIQDAEGDDVVDERVAAPAQQLAEPQPAPAEARIAGREAEQVRQPAEAAARVPGRPGLVIEGIDPPEARVALASPREPIQPKMKIFGLPAPAQEAVAVPLAQEPKTAAGPEQTAAAVTVAALEPAARSAGPVSEVPAPASLAAAPFAGAPVAAQPARAR
ncbi:caspase family protein, partial [Propylenella binzhouense]